MNKVASLFTLVILISAFTAVQCGRTASYTPKIEVLHTQLASWVREVLCSLFSAMEAVIPKVEAHTAWIKQWVDCQPWQESLHFPKLTRPPLEELSVSIVPFDMRILYPKFDPAIEMLLAYPAPIAKSPPNQDESDSVCPALRSLVSDEVHTPLEVANEPLVASLASLFGALNSLCTEQLQASVVVVLCLILASSVCGARWIFLATSMAHEQANNEARARFLMEVEDALAHKRKAQESAVIHIQNAWRKKQAETRLEQLARKKVLARDRAASVLQRAWRRRKLQQLTKTHRSIARKMWLYSKMSIYLQKVNVPDDGNCLFHAISVAEFGNRHRHAEVRRVVCDWLAENAEYIVRSNGLQLYFLEGFESPSEWPSFVRKMRADKEYGTSACLYAAAEVYKATIHLLDADNTEDLHIRQRKELDNGEYVRSVIWLAFGDKHYSPLLVSTSPTSQIMVPEKMPPDMRECSCCSRWCDLNRPTCHRCGTKKMEKIRK